MIGKISIKFKKSAEEVAEVLSSKNITLRIKAAFGFETEIDAEWQGLENLNKFKFIPVTFGPVVPWKGSCTLKNSNVEGKSELKITIWPPKFFVILIIGIIFWVLFTVLYEEYKYPEAANLMTSFCLMSIFFCVLIGIWRLVFQNTANKVKGAIIQSLKENNQS
ncbi:MAG: hypothetical protein ABJG68_04565 [Crocinitomicaceae bacterium]